MIFFVFSCIFTSFSQRLVHNFDDDATQVMTDDLNKRPMVMIVDDSKWVGWPGYAMWCILFTLGMYSRENKRILCRSTFHTISV